MECEANEDIRFLKTRLTVSKAYKKNQQAFFHFWQQWAWLFKLTLQLKTMIN